MKASGMSLIVFGHAGGQSLLPPTTHPINIKQLGVAFFVFIAGYTLATEKRSPRIVVFNRYFDVAYFGLLTALILSVINWFRLGDPNESNYLPYIFGVNVLDNDFPANSTTWFSGCYFHLLVFWALVLRRFEPTWKVFCLAALVELTVRAIVILADREYTAYMLLTNWLLVLLLGQLMGTRRSATQAELADQTSVTSFRRPIVALGSTLTLAAFAVAWAQLVREQQITFSTTFGHFPKLDRFSSAVATTVSVSLQYCLYTFGAYHIAQALPNLRFVQFLARNTLIVFLIHMPVILWLRPRLNALLPSSWTQALCNQLIYFVFLACVSSLAIALAQPKRLRSWLGFRLFGQAFQQ